MQEKIARHARYITVLTRESVKLFESEHGLQEKLLLVPTGVDRELPAPGANPFEDINEKVVVYIGNLYDRNSQREINELWQGRLNSIGTRLRKLGIRLVVIGPGDARMLDPAAVHFLGLVENRYIYDYMRNANAGLVLAQGPVQHNESSKLYELVRCGVPVVSEYPVPNNHILSECNWGSVANYGNDAEIASLLVTAVTSKDSGEMAVEHMLNHHSWDHRAAQYSELLRKSLTV